MTHPNVPQALLEQIVAAGELSNHGGPVTVGRLADWLARLPRDLPVVTIPHYGSDGGEGSPVSNGTVEMYTAESTWAGTLNMREDQRQREQDPDEWDEAPASAVPVVYLSPVS